MLGATIIVIAGVGIWHQIFRDDAPPPVSLDSAIENLGSTLATTTQVSAEATATAPSVSTEAPTATQVDERTTTEQTSGAATPASGQEAESATDTMVWTIDESGDSFVGYRVGEELARIGTTEAVGRTNSVNGSFTISGTTITDGEIEADLTDLQSDDSRRDGRLETQALETGTFPTASFTLTQTIELGEVPSEGVTFSAIATGDLTLHGETRPVEIPLEAQFTNGLLIVVGSLEIQFADYNISPPTAPAVLSVNDFGTLELQLVFGSEQSQ